MIEQWKDITAYKGIYMVSNKGRIKVLAKKVHRGRGNPLASLPEKILKLKITTNGYYKIDLHKDKKPKTVLVHRVVAFAFCLGYKEGYTVNHEDGNKLNNIYTNLKWGTHKYNIHHACENNLRNYLYGEKHQNSKITDRQRLQIIKLKDQGISTKRIAKKYKICEGSVYYILNKKNTN